MAIKSNLNTPRLVQLGVLVLFLGFSLLTLSNTAVGLTGVGTLLMVVSMQVFASKDEIWTSYKKNYKKSSNELTNRLQEPKLLYYQINIYVLVPLMFLLGVGSVWIASRLG